MDGFGLNFVLATYAIIWVFFYGYIAIINMKLARLEKELSDLSGDNS